MRQVFISRREAAARRSSEMESRDHSNAVSPKNHRSRGNVKRRTFLFFAALCICVARTFAQDVITLKNGDDIQALVQEIGEVDIKYKKYDNPNGPNYTLKKSEIFMIRYVNGSKDVFKDNPPPVTETTSEPTEKSTPVLAVTATIKSAETNTSTPKSEQLSIQSNKGEVYLNIWGNLKYRSTNAKVTNVVDLFYVVPDALENYKSGKTWNAIGGGIVGAGACIAFWDIFNNWEYETHNSLHCPIYWTGMGVILVGGIFNQLGRSKITTAIDLYNTSVRRNQISDISLNFGITRTGGIGLTLNF